MPKKHKRKRTREPAYEEDDFSPLTESDPTPEKAPTYTVTLAYLLDQEEVRGLIEASQTSIAVDISVEPKTDYATYSEDEVGPLMEGTYHPRKSKKKK